MMVVLSFAIPTYNRPECVSEVLESYAASLSEWGLQDKVEICLSDNSENRKTEAIARRFRKRIRHLRYKRNGKNLGYDANMISAVSLATGNYIAQESDEFILYGERIAELVGSLEREKPELVYVLSHHAAWDGHRKLMASGEKYVASGWLAGAFLSPGGVHHRVMTHLTMFIIRRKDFRDFLRLHGKDVQKFYGLSFVQTAFYFFCLKSSGRALLYRKMERRGEVRPKKLDIYLPRDISNILLWKYFKTILLCGEVGILSGAEIAEFKRNYFADFFQKSLRIRSHMYPALYAAEEEAVKKNLRDIGAEYRGWRRAAIQLWVRLVFNAAVPYHLLYRAYLLAWRLLGRNPADLTLMYKNYYSNKEEFAGSWKKTGF